MITDYLASLFIRSRLVVFAGVLVITGLAVWGHLPEREVIETPPPPPANSAKTTTDQTTEQKPAERPARERIESEFNLTRAECLLIVDADDLFAPRTMEAVRRMVEDVEALDVVDHLVWLETVPILNIFGLPDPLLPPAGSSAERYRLARARALQHPLVVGQLLSDDGNALQMPIRYDWVYATREDSGGPEIVEAARRSLDRSLGAHAGTVRLKLTGRVPLWKAERDAFKSGHFKYQLIAYSMILFLAVLLFRGIRPVFIVAAAPALAVFWTLGLLGLFGRETNDMTSVVMPVLIAMVSFTDGVHLMIHIRRCRADGLEPVEAAASALKHVGLPCFLTSLTTAIGFASLLLAESEYVHDFGLDCAIGVIAGFVAVITVIPLVSSTWLGRNLASHQADDLVARNLDRFVPAINWIIRRAGWVTAAAILLTAGLAAVAAQLRPDEKLEYAMPNGADAYQALAWCDEAFGGIEFATVTIHWDDLPADDPANVLAVVREVQQLVRQEPSLKHPLSIDDLLRTFPSDTQDAATLMSFADLLPPPLRDLFYKPHESTATVLMRCQDRGIRFYAPVFERVQTGLATIQARHPGFAIELDGGPVWRAKNLYRMVVDLATSLGSATFIIMVILGLAYRSVRIGLIAIIPNLLPLLATATLLVISGDSLNIAGVCAFTVCLGIAVDDTIHFLSRFQDELRVDGDIPAAIRRSFLAVGTALVTTTLVLVSGFATVLASQMPAHRIFAGMAVATIGTALVGDLLFLPALLTIFYRRSENVASETVASDNPASETIVAPPALGME